MKYSCEQVRDFLPAYIDNMTNNFETEAIEKHLSECAECRSELEFLEAIIGKTTSLPSFEVPEGFESRLREKLITEKNLKRSAALSKMRKTAIPIVSAVAVFAIFIVSLSFIQSKNTDIDPLSRSSQSETTIDGDEIKRKSVRKKFSILSDIFDIFEPEPKPTKKPDEKPKHTATATATAPPDENKKLPDKPPTQTKAPAKNDDFPDIDYSKAVPKIKVTTTVLATPGDKEIVKQILSAGRFLEGYYLLSESQYQNALSQFDMLGISVSVSKEDKTIEYAQLESMLNTSGVDKTNIQMKLGVIDEEASTHYVQIAR